MASFEIVEVTGAGNVSLPHLGVFPDGKMAAGVVASMLLHNPEKKYQPRPIMVSADWRKRETEKNHPHLPWGDALKPIPDHFACVSDKDPAMVSYFASENSGKLDRRTNVHVNRYLLEFYSFLPVDTRRRLVWNFTGENPANLLFASTAEDIVDIYERGPSSCMSHESSYYAPDENPTAAYAGPDLQLAYVNDEYGDPVARTVVWPAKKIFSTIYGDEEKLLPELKKLGYRKSFFEFEGARLTLRRAGGYFAYDGEDVSGYLCPYIDFASSVEPIDGYLVVTRKGRYECQSQSGVAERAAKRCWKCKSMRNQHAFFDVDEYPTESVCQDCAHDKLVICAYEQRYLSLGCDAHAISGGRYVGNYAYRHHTFVCLGNGQRYLQDEAVYHQGDKYSEEGLAQFLRSKAA
ncbi:hypothetical protein [Mesorhizobium sp. STM 4661]|uniref:hypothetical protein n=1 Tax=Mesorhizobium sp. STM 4661 TaxID=1297570 RepID=UPI0002BF03ED|nr:hypothetical protein [Mesorhizobium sp. STM 4661]CCV12973.1 hypothetical protein MESS4_510140 [Mesorhizobium sp. STM 4661]